MATVILPNSTIALPAERAVDDRHGIGFMLLLAVVATLFLRPADLFPAFESWPIYQFLIAACLAVSFRSLVRQLAYRQLDCQPVTACLLLLLLAIMSSHLAHGFTWAARMSAAEFVKLLSFYLLIVGIVNTRARFQTFLKCLTLVIATIAGIALLDRTGVITVAALESIRDRGAMLTGGDDFFVERLRGTGIFQDPNDFGLILVSGVVLSCGFWLRPRAGLPRHAWLIPLAILLTALSATHSRGALLSLALAVPAAVTYARGLVVGLLSTAWLPILALGFSARMTDLNAVHTGTGQSRIQIWSESLTIWKQYPMFGLGEGLLVEEIGVVTHNSYLQCFAELGIIGGFAFIACFFAACWSLWLAREASPPLDVDAATAKVLSDNRHWRMCIFAVLVAYCGGMLTLSRQFVTPTYLILGMSCAAQTLRSSRSAELRLNNRFLIYSLGISFTALLGFYFLIRIFASWS